MVTHDRIRTLVHLSLDNGQKITTTDGHPFKTQDGWRDAILLKKGGKLLLKGPDGESDQLTVIDEVRIEQITVKTYNLEVANAHTFYVGDAGVLVHNGFGSYAGWFSDGTAYAGKGDESRMRESMKRELAKKPAGTTLRKCKHFSGPTNNRDSFIAEDVVIERLGGVGGGRLTNRINSPGKGYRGR